jgi:hypothetical protein
MSITSNFPAIKPTLNLSFALTKQLDPRITFTRASTATYYGTQTAKAEENLLLQSQDFTTSWSNTGTTDTADTSVAPDGTTTADTLTENPSGTGQAAISQSTSFTAGLPYTFSIFVKQGTQTFAQLLFGSGAFGVNAYANFNVTTGAGAVGTVGSSTTASIVDAGNGWYRCIITATATTTTSVSAQLNIIESATDARAPSITLDSGTILLWGAQLEQRSTVTAYTPTTTQPITNYIPQLLTAASGVARFDHNPTTFESLGLLIEESRTNLVTYSEQFDNAAWSKSNSTITANTIVSPDGALTGDKLVEDTANSTHFVQRNATVTFTAAAHTWSVYLKAGERTWARLTMLDGATTFGAYFNLSTGAIGATAAGTTATATPVGNGWYRCSVTATTAATASGSARIIAANADSGQTYTGDGYSGIYIWGAQLEVGAFPTSYIPTVASQVTRAADAASMTGANFSSWYNQAEGTLYAEATSGNSTNDSGRIASINDNTSNNRAEVLYSAATQMQAILSLNNATQASITETVTKTNSNKTSFAYKVNNTNASFNSSVETTDTSCDVPVVSQINIGARSGNSNSINGHIRKLSYYPLRLSNTNLVALTN